MRKELIEVVEKMNREELRNLDLIVSERLEYLRDIENNKIKPFDDYEDVYVLENFIELEESGFINDDDGGVYYATKEGVSGVCYFTNDSPEWATHVAFYGK